MRRYDPEDMPSGICDCCGEACTAQPIDVGIGPYEYWGARGNHVDIQLLSPCCEAEVVEGGQKLIRTAKHVAKKPHNNGQIQPGDTYYLRVYRHWRCGGPTWITVKKIKQTPTMKEQASTYETLMAVAALQERV